METVIDEPTPEQREVLAETADIEEQLAADCEGMG